MPPQSRYPQQKRLPATRRAAIPRSRPSMRVTCRHFWQVTVTLRLRGDRSETRVAVVMAAMGETIEAMRTELQHSVPAVRHVLTGVSGF